MKTAIKAGVIFGLIMGLIFGVSGGLSSGIVGFVVSGGIFGLFIGLFLKFQTKKFSKMEKDVSNGKEVIRSGAGIAARLTGDSYLVKRIVEIAEHSVHDIGDRQAYEKECSITWRSNGTKH